MTAQRQRHVTATPPNHLSHSIDSERDNTMTMSLGRQLVKVNTRQTPRPPNTRHSAIRRPDLSEAIVTLPKTYPLGSQ